MVQSAPLRYVTRHGLLNGAVGSSSLCYTAWTAECRQRWRPDAFNFTNDKNNAQFS